MLKRRITGKLAQTLHHTPAVALLGPRQVGKSREGFVIENILSVLGNQAETYFYRTAAGAEIDLLINLPGKELWAIEIKNGVAPKIKQGFHIACKDVKATRKYVVYGGDDEFPIGKDTIVLSLESMLVKLGE